MPDHPRILGAATFDRKQQETQYKTKTLVFYTSQPDSDLMRNSKRLNVSSLFLQLKKRKKQHNNNKPKLWLYVTLHVI